jgi:2-phospho-L-lactate guanylyltransferase (CobY/MobA/RfbA family)
VSHASIEPSYSTAATESQIRGAAAQLLALAERHGLSQVAFASPGRLRAQVDDDRDLADVFAFQREASDLVRARIDVFSDGALSNRHVSRDLVEAVPI